MRSAPRRNIALHSKQTKMAVLLLGIAGLSGLNMTFRPHAHGLMEGPAHAEERAKAAPRDLAQLTSSAADLSASIKVTKYDSAELEKIGSDFKSLYSIRNARFQYKQPDKIRFEARSQTR